MVDVSQLFDLKIYTIAGLYVGKVHDVVLNIRLGTIAKLQVKIIDSEKKNIGFADIFKKGLQFVPEDDEMENFKETLISVDYDKVRAIGDIMLIDPQDLFIPKGPVATQETTPQGIGI
ncbi:PRC-barrel domain-containing protein [Methanobrevibacter filiformis]|uniref:PRC-barrel domain protein n=1 Tax=Methanobrevibacter filiformis TaxID=55758 RepID=A0A166F480_9EURY|nr:PRC-barrel domain-containing protein [Methanobrevibacter filiformis]KZX17295.1 PRC-barrel domain protein [Methanobrevibacter filiformis]